MRWLKIKAEVDSHPSFCLLLLFPASPTCARATHACTMVTMFDIAAKPQHGCVHRRSIALVQVR